MSEYIINRISIVDNVFVRMMKFRDVGDCMDGHAHAFDHITLLSTGSVKMEHTNGVQEFTAPHLIVTPKGIHHKFTALEPNTVICCIHAIRDGDGLDDVIAPDAASEEVISALENYPLAWKDKA